MGRRILGVMVGLSMGGVSACAGTGASDRAHEDEVSAPSPEEVIARMHRLAAYYPEPRGMRHYALGLRVEVGAEGFIVFSRGVRSHEPIREFPKHVTYDYAALGKLALELKMLFPHDGAVELEVAPGVPLGVVANTIIGMRGSGCGLAGMLDGLDITAECLFWTPVMTLPEGASRTELALLLVTRGLAPWDALWSTMDHRPWYDEIVAGIERAPELEP